MTYRIIRCEFCKSRARVFRSPSAKCEPRFCNRQCSNSFRARLANSRSEARRRFWAKVRRAAGCWTWTGALQPGKHNYGSFRFDGERMGAHRVAWILTHGDPGEMFVLHHCDNPRCVRPSHLWLGTHADNMRDMVLKGRQWKRGAA